MISVSQGTGKNLIREDIVELTHHCRMKEDNKSLASLERCGSRTGKKFGLSAVQSANNRVSLQPRGANKQSRLTVRCTQRSKIVTRTRRHTSSRRENNSWMSTERIGGLALISDAAVSIPWPKSPIPQAETACENPLRIISIGYQRFETQRVPPRSIRFNPTLEFM